MCYGMNCGRETKGLGTCVNPQTCFFNDEPEGNPVKESQYTCPNCKRRLAEDNTGYLCVHCVERYDRQRLVECLKDEHADLVSDAETVQKWIDELESNNEIL